MANSKYLDVTNLPWDKDINDNIFDYTEIKNKNTESDPNDAMIYYFTAEKGKLMRGLGVLEMQMKLANIFRHYQFNIYKKYYIENEEYRKAVTSGIYGPKTTELIMIFQTIYLNDHFKGNWDPKKGFGVFGEHTRRKLESIFKKLRNQVSRRRRLKKTT